MAESGARGRRGRALAPILCLPLACGTPDEPRAADAALEVPAPRAGADLLGRALPLSSIPRWIGEPVALGGDEAPRAVLLRWWTDACPYCEASLPAIETLRERWAAEGLATVAVHHPKPPRAEPDDAIAAAARERGYHGPLAADPTWSALESVWLSTGRRAATSASFLLDATGTIRFVHPGPELHPSDDPAHATCQADFADLDRAIRALLEG